MMRQLGAVAESVAEALAGQLVTSAVNLDLGATVSPEVKPFLQLAEQLETERIPFGTAIANRSGSGSAPQ